jgi:hypothetical protein
MSCMLLFCNHLEACLEKEKNVPKFRTLLSGRSNIKPRVLQGKRGYSVLCVCVCVCAFMFMHFHWKMWNKDWWWVEDWLNLEIFGLVYFWPNLHLQNYLFEVSPMAIPWFCISPCPQRMEKSENQCTEDRNR